MWEQHFQSTNYNLAPWKSQYLESQHPQPAAKPKQEQLHPGCVTRPRRTFPIEGLSLQSRGGHMLHS